MGETASSLSSVAQRLTDEVLAPMKQAFVGKDEIIDLLGVSLVARENLFLLGPPGTAKSALVQDLSRRVDGDVFDYLLTRFTEPNEIFGPFDIRKLRDGDLVTNTEGMLPEAAFVFLDELLNANSAILNSLLMVLNERVFRRGRESRSLPTLVVVGASNRLPEDEALGALFDRFLLRVRCDNVPQEELANVLVAGWQLDMHQTDERPKISVDDVRGLHEQLKHVDLSRLLPDYIEVVHRLRHAGISVSDRRAVKLQRIMAASALLSGRTVAQITDMWVLRYIWDKEEQQDVLASIVNAVLSKVPENELASAHPRARSVEAPNPEHLAADLERLATKLEQTTLPPTEVAYVRDQLGLLASRCQWVTQDPQRSNLQQRINQLLQAAEGR